MIQLLKLYWRAKSMNINKLLDKAICEIDNLNVNESFSLKDLFKGYEWKRLNQGEKSTLGTLFLNYANSETKIEVIQKSSNQREYRIKK